MKTYNLNIPHMLVALVFLAMTLMTFMLPVLYFLNNNALVLQNRPPGFLVFPLYLIMAWKWWIFLNIPYRIKVHDDGKIEFNSFFKKTVILNSDIISIRPTGGKLGKGKGFFVIEHQKGRLRIFQQFSGFHEILSFIQSSNPNFKIIGCEIR